MSFSSPCWGCQDRQASDPGSPHRPAGPRGTSGRDDCGRSRTKQRHDSDRGPLYAAAAGFQGGETGHMDVTTVNDRHLYRATVVLRDAQDPMGQVELPARVVRFGPPGWLTVVHGSADAGVVVLYPTARV